MFFKKLQIVKYFLAISWIVTTTKGQGWNCTFRPNMTTTIENGWPLRLSCKHLVLNRNNLTEAQCCIYNEDNEKIVFNKTINLERSLKSQFKYKVFKKPINTSVNFKIMLKQTYSDKSRICSAVRLNVKIVMFKNETCQQSINRTNPTTTESSHMDLSKFTCDRDLDIDIEYERVDESDQMTSYPMRFRWMKDCMPIENANKNQYKVMSMTFDHPGVYTCRATYNGMTKYLSHYKKCVRHRDQYSEPTIHCHDVVKEVIVGSSFNLTLNSQLGFGGVDRVSLLWFKLHDETSNGEEFICSNNSPQHSNDGIKCSQITDSENSNTHNQCFSKPPEAPLRVPGKIIVPSHLRFKKLKKSDLGFYEFRIHRPGSKLKKCRIQLKQASLQPKKQFTNRLIVSICTLLLVIFLIILGVYYRVFIKICIKRSFIRSSIDSCKVFLFYRYSSEMNEKDQKMVKESVQSIDCHLKRFGCETFDENRDGRVSFNTSEDLEDIISGCDRVVLLLISKDFIEDNWSIFKLQKSFEKSMETKSKLIFILGPGMRKMIKESASSNDTCFFIQRAMKMSHVIEWSVQRMKTQRFVYELELAIPKIQSVKIQQQAQYIVPQQVEVHV